MCGSEGTSVIIHFPPLILTSPPTPMSLRKYRTMIRWNHVASHFRYLCLHRPTCYRYQSPWSHSFLRVRRLANVMSVATLPPLSICRLRRNIHVSLQKFLRQEAVRIAGYNITLVLTLWPSSLNACIVAPTRTSIDYVNHEHRKRSQISRQTSQATRAYLRKD